MQQTLALTLPFFAVVALGWFAAWRGMLEGNAVRSLNVFCFYFAMPALIVGALSKHDLRDLNDLDFAIVWLTSGLVVFSIGAILAKVLFRGSLSEIALSGQAAAIGNLGFLGLPLVLLAFGEGAAPWIALILIIDLLLIIPLSIVLLEIAVVRSGGDGSVFNAVSGVLRNAILNPFLIAIGIGMLFAWLQPPKLAPFERFLTFLGNAAAPAALFALGASLVGKPVSADRAPVMVLSALKLVVHPVLVYLGFQYAGSVTPIQFATGVCMAAMPIAGNVFVIAEQYGHMVRRVSTSVLVSTVISVATAAFALSLFKTVLN